MSELHNLANDIERLRENLNKILEKKNTDLQDPEVVSASELLNAVILKYNELLQKKLNP